MSDNFQLLKSDDDVLLFEQHTFIVGRFRELCFEEVKIKIYLAQSKSMVIFDQLNGWLRIDNPVYLKLNSSKWESVTE